MKRAPLLLGLILLLSAASARAQTSGENALALSLPEAVERALSSYPSITAARARVVEAEAATGEARASQGPIVKLNAQGLQYDDPMITSPIHSFVPADFPPFDETIVQGALSVSYVLLDSGAARERTRQAQAQSANAGAALSAAEQAVAARVASVYAGALSRAEILAAQRARTAALELEVDRARQFVATGKAAEVELLRAEASLAAAEAERTRAASALDASERDLARLVGIPVDAARAETLSPWNPPASEEMNPEIRERLAERAVAAAPAIEQARQQIASTDAARALARSAYFPKVELVGAVQEFRESASDYATDWNAGFQVVVPIWDGGQTGRRVARAAAARDSAVALLAQTELDVREAVDRAANSLADAQARSVALERAALRLTEVARVQKLLLEVGAGTQVDYLAAEAELATTRAAATEARTTALLSRVELARLAGELSAQWFRTTPEAVP